MKQNQIALNNKIYYAQIILDDLKKVVKKAEKEINRLRKLRYERYGGLIPNFMKKNKQSSLLGTKDKKE